MVVDVALWLCVVHTIKFMRSLCAGARTAPTSSEQIRTRTLVFLSLSFISAPRQATRQTALFNCFFLKTIKNSVKSKHYYTTVPRLTQFKSWTKKLITASSED